MSVSLSIHITPESLHMYGEPDTTSAYSLSGHIAVSLLSPPSFFDHRRTAHFHLQSLSLTFEGQSEVCAPAIGYSATRLCSITRELVPTGQLIHLSNEGHEDSSEPCVWNIIFNIPIPGWLPATSLLGSEVLGVRYGLYATANLLDLDDNRSSPWMLALLCAPFRSQAKIVQARQPVVLERFAAAPSSEPLEPSNTHFLVNNPMISSKGGQAGKKRVPQDILSKIQVIFTVPDFVDMDGDEIPVTLRMRANGLSEDDCRRFKLLEVSTELRQVEKFRCRPSTNYNNKFPLPPKERQPPNDPLLDPSPLSCIYDVSLFSMSARSDAIRRSFYLMPPHESGRYTLPENSYIFAKDTNTPSPDVLQEVPAWYAMKMTIPFMKESKSPANNDWGVPTSLRPTATSPLVVIYHEAAISITCAYQLPGSEEIAQEKLTFTVPIHFRLVAPSPPAPSLLLLVPQGSSPSTHNPNVPTLPIVEPYATSLPVYSQLYDADGERKTDYSTPLPLYRPPSPPEDNTSRRKWQGIRQLMEDNDGDDDDDQGETVPLLEFSSVQ